MIHILIYMEVGVTWTRTHIRVSLRVGTPTTEAIQI